MPEPGLFEKLRDSLAVWIHGGVRVRVWHDGGVVQASVLGKMKGLSPENLLAIVLDLKPEGYGTVHFRNLGDRNWKIRVSGTLAEGNLEQRLRNTVVNR